METLNTSQLDEAMRLQREGEALVQEGKYDEGMARFEQLLTLLGRSCPPERRAKAEMWLGWILNNRGEKSVAKRKFALAARLLAPFKDSYPREWIWLCNMNSRVEGRKASDAAADALRGLLRKAGAAAGAVSFWERTDFSDEVSRGWVNDQDQLAIVSLNALKGRMAVRKRVHSLYHGGVRHVHLANTAVYYATYGAGGHNPHVMRCPRWSEAPSCVLRPSECGKNVHFAGYSISPDERYAVVALSGGGGDIVDYRIKDLKRNRFIKDAVTGLHFFRIAWHDARSFYYVREQQVMLHRIGTRTAHDTVVFDAPGDVYITPWVSNDDLFIIVHNNGDGSIDYYRRNKNGKRWQKYENLGGTGARLQWAKKGALFVSSFNGSNFGKLLRLDYRTRKSSTHMRPASGWYLNHIIAMGLDGGITYMTKKNMREALEIRRHGKRVKRVLLPPLTESTFVGRPNRTSFLLSTSSPISPPSIYQVDSKTLKMTLRFKSAVEFDTGAYEQSVHWFNSDDGTRVPVQIVQRRGVSLADAPIKMYVYGGFRNPSIPADWDSYNATLLQLGCNIAFVGARGGGELGHEWHKVAMHGRKDLPARDTVCGAKYLASLGIPASRIGLEGGSNGGLIAAAALAMSPESFGCAVITNPVIDVASCSDRYETEYGNPKRHKARIAAYSPLNLLKPASYPAILVKVHANDDRVPPSNGYRFVAKVQSMQEGTSPIILRVYNGAGHSGWTTWSTSGEDTVLFFLHHLGLRAR